MNKFAAKVKGSIIRNFNEEPVLTIAVGILTLSALALVICLALIFLIGGSAVYYPVVFLYGLHTLTLRVSVILAVLAALDRLIDLKIDEALAEARR